MVMLASLQYMFCFVLMQMSHKDQRTLSAYLYSLLSFSTLKIIFAVYKILQGYVITKTKSIHRSYSGQGH